MHKKSVVFSFVIIVLLGVLSSGSLFARIEVEDVPGLTAKGRKHFPEIPDLTRGGQKNDKHDWNLGPTGARGWMWGMRLRTDYARQILITKVEPGSPAEGILAVDDVVLGVDGKRFDSDARIAFGNAIEESTETPEGLRSIEDYI